MLIQQKYRMRKVAAVISFLAGWFWGLALLISRRLSGFGDGAPGAGPKLGYLAVDIFPLVYFAFCFAIIVVRRPRRSLLVLAVLTHLLIIPLLIEVLLDSDNAIVGLSFFGYVVIWWFGFWEALDGVTKKARKIGITWRF